jgi:hypothetical protein
MRSRQRSCRDLTRFDEIQKGDITATFWVRRVILMILLTFIPATFFISMTGCVNPPGELPIKYFKMASATYYKWGGADGGPWIEVQLTSDSPNATVVFADKDGTEELPYTSILSLPGKQLIGAGGSGGHSIELDPSTSLDPIADQGITVQADTTIWFYIEGPTGFTGGTYGIVAKCRFDTPSVPIVFAGQ